MWKQLLFKNKE